MGLPPAFLQIEGTTVVLPPPPPASTASLVVQANASVSSPIETQAVTLIVNLINPADTDRSGIQVTDILPSGLTYVSASMTKGTYSHTTGLWNVGSLLHRSVEVLYILATVDVGEAGSSLTNTATITATDYADDDTSQHTDSIVITVQDPTVTAPLLVNKVADKINPAEGDTVTFTVTAINPGITNRSGVVITDLLPTGFTYTGATPSQGAYVSGTGVWTVGTVGDGESVSLTISATVDAGTDGTTITNTATITAADETDSDTSGYTSSVAVLVKNAGSSDPDAPLAMVKTVNISNPIEGQQIAFTLQVLNPGSLSRTGVVVSDILPSGLTMIQASGDGAYSETTGTWTVGSIGAGLSAYLFITVETDSGTAGTTITNTATIAAADLTDTDTSDYADSAPITVATASATSPLSLLKTVNDATPDELDEIFFTVTVSNPGTTIRSGVEVTDGMPTGLIATAVNLTSGTYSSSTHIWSLGDIAAGGFATAEFYATLQSGTAEATIVNTAVITAADETDTDQTHYSSTATLTVNAITTPPEDYGMFGTSPYGTTPYGVGVVQAADMGLKLLDDLFVVPNLSPGSDRIDRKAHPLVAEVIHERNGVIVGSRTETVKYRWRCLWRNVTEAEKDGLLKFFLLRKFYLVPYGDSTLDKWVVRWLGSEFEIETVRGGFYNITGTLQEA